MEDAIGFSDYDMNRVHVELEKLNIATDVINKLELQLDEARGEFRDIQNSWTQKIETLSKKLGSCIEKARPYYTSRIKTRDALLEAQAAAQKFERANSVHSVAKQQVSLTQESLTRQQGSPNIDSACLEVLNHHIQRVNEAEKERLASEAEHRIKQSTYEDANRLVAFLEKDLKRSISKSKPYFDANVEFTRLLEQKKAYIHCLEAEIRQKKMDYAGSLQRLEQMSEEIHLSRQLGKRDPGVGSETPGPPVSQEHRSSEQTTKDGLRKMRSISEPIDPMKLGVSLEPKAVGDVRLPLSSNLSSGIILLAQQLSEYDLILGKQTGRDARFRAFTLPVDTSADCIYKTQPDGVKPLPTPPLTPLTSVVKTASRSSSLNRTQPNITICVAESEGLPKQNEASAYAIPKSISSPDFGKKNAQLDTPNSASLCSESEFSYVDSGSESDASSLARFGIAATPNQHINDDNLTRALQTPRTFSIANSNTVFNSIGDVVVAPVVEKTPHLSTDSGTSTVIDEFLAERSSGSGQE